MAARRTTAPTASSFTLRRLPEATTPTLFRRNAKRYLERWGERVRRDDLEIYAEDGLLELVPGDLYPLELRVDPLPGDGRRG